MEDDKQKWEYTYLEKGPTGWGTAMIEYGRKGWECYAVTINNILYTKIPFNIYFGEVVYRCDYRIMKFYRRGNLYLPTGSEK